MWFPDWSCQCELRIENHEDECDQKQNAAGRRELLEHRPEELLGDVPDAPHRALPFVRALEIFRVEPVARARFLFKLRPELVEFEAFSDAQPEAVQLFAKRQRRRRTCRKRRSVGGRHIDEKNYTEREGSRFQSFRVSKFQSFKVMIRA